MTAKIVPGYSRYTATEDAVIYDTQRAVEVAQVLTGKPEYLYVNVWNDSGKRVLRRVHQLVALAHIPNPDKLPLVDHKDRNRMHNHVQNLRWATRKDNACNREDNVILGGLRSFVYEYCVTRPEHYYHKMWRQMKNGASLEEAWNHVFPEIPCPPQKKDPLN